RAGGRAPAQGRRGGAAPGETADPLVEQFAQPERLDQLLCPLLDLRGRGAVEEHLQGEVLVHGQVVVDTGRLRRIADQLPHPRRLPHGVEAPNPPPTRPRAASPAWSNPPPPPDPEVCRSNVTRILTVLIFPEPFGPRKPNT